MGGGGGKEGETEDQKRRSGIRETGNGKGQKGKDRREGRREGERNRKKIRG